MSPTPPLLDDMVVFAEVVDAGGITAAAARLGLRKSTVSRRLAALEERLGTRLLERNTRRLRLTESGREYHAHCARLVAEARAINQALSESRDTLLFFKQGKVVGQIVGAVPKARLESAFQQVL